VASIDDLATRVSGETISRESSRLEDRAFAIPLSASRL